MEIRNYISLLDLEEEMDVCFSLFFSSHSYIYMPCMRFLAAPIFDVLLWLDLEDGLRCVELR